MCLGLILADFFSIKSLIFAKNNDISKKSPGYSFQGLCLKKIIEYSSDGNNSRVSRSAPPPGTHLEFKRVGSNRVKESVQISILEISKNLT